MQTSHQGLLDVAERKRRYRTSMMPLADAMFLLLIFFMLSSNVTPFTLLPLQAGRASEQAEAETASTSIDRHSGEAGVWTLRAKGELVINGTPIPIGQLSSKVEDFRVAGISNLVLLVEDRTRVQHLATTLETLAAAGIKRIRISRTGV